MLRAVSHSLALFLPALAPSWRFFEEIKPSPRIEIAVLRGERAEARRWAEFRPKPETVSIGALIVRLVFNPHRNENLYLLTACEKFLLEESHAARRTILARIRSDLSGVAASEAQNPERSWVVFRIAALRREGHMHDLAMLMRQHGILAFAPNVPPYNPVRIRAQIWKARIKRVLEITGAEKVHLIARSMGGLDARYLISAEGYHRHVRTQQHLDQPECSC